MQHIPFKHDWIFHLDADERVTPGLAKAMLDAVSQPGQTANGFRVMRRDNFMGRWLKHVTPSVFFIRLFRKGRVRYEKLINPVTRIDGEIGELNEYIDHYPFSKGMTQWIDKHNKYSYFEAAQIVQNRKNHSQFNVAKAFFEPDRNLRHAQQKELYYRLPCRPLVMFLMLYVVKLGFLDGAAGFRFARLRAMYEYMIVIKAQDMLAEQKLKQAKSENVL
jgi:hypothetical protein